MDPTPASWAPQIVQGKTYSVEEPDGLALWEEVTTRLQSRSTSTASERFGTPMLVRPRLGQGAFRLLVTDMYHRRCAVTQERTLPALDAAHIRPYAEGGVHDVSNGLLLRRDLHSLFDRGYVTVTPELRFEVSRRIKEEFENGRTYYALHGGQVHIPDRTRGSAGCGCAHLAQRESLSRMSSPDARLARGPRNQTSRRLTGDVTHTARKPRRPGRARHVPQPRQRLLRSARQGEGRA